VIILEGVLMQSKSTGNRSTQTPGSCGAEAKSCKPELVAVEVANLQGELVVVHNKPQDGTALEAAAELHKLTEVLSGKAEELKTLADQAFLGEADSQLAAQVAAQPEALEQMHLPTAVQEAVDNLREKIADVQLSDAEATPKQAADQAQALDKVVEVLESSSDEIKDMKLCLAAKELNNMDGFDR
jgi:hypothetical protein